MTKFQDPNIEDIFETITELELLVDRANESPAVHGVSADRLTRKALIGALISAIRMINSQSYLR